MKNFVTVTLIFIAIAAEFKLWGAILDLKILFVLILVFSLTFSNIKEITIRAAALINFVIKFFSK